MPAITAKVTPYSKFETGVGEHREVKVSFSADYADGRNKEWARFTPSLSLEITMKGEVADKFAIGKGYTLTFEQEPEALSEALPEAADRVAAGEQLA